MPDSIRHPKKEWIPASAGMTEYQLWTVISSFISPLAILQKWEGQDPTKSCPPFFNPIFHYSVTPALRLPPLYLYTREGSHNPMPGNM